jgi:polar amino acid transport system substrate-binding protein
MLDRPGDAGGDVELRRHDLAGLPHLPVVGRVARVHRRAARAQAGVELVGQRRHHFRELLRAAERPAARDDDLGRRQLGPVALGHLTPDEAGLARIGHRVGVLDRGAAASGRRGVEAGRAHRDDLDRIGALHRGDGVARVDRALEGVGRIDLGDVDALRDVELVVFDAAGKSVEAVADERTDIGFFAIDPVRGAQIAFTDGYVHIEGAYLVRDASALRANYEVDRAGTRVTVGKGSAYDLYLTRELKQAEIVRAPTSPTVVATFLEQGLDVAAGVKQQLEADAARHPGLRLLPRRFMVIRQAMGCPKSRSEAAARVLGEFVEAMKAAGFVADALRRHGIESASVAPAASAQG